MAKIYIDGTSCKSVTGQYGEFFNISVNLEKLKEYVNEKGYVNMTMSKRKEPGQYGDTHYFTLNEWNPEGANNNSNSQSDTSEDSNKNNSNNNNGDISVEDIPF